MSDTAMRYPPVGSAVAATDMGRSNVPLAEPGPPNAKAKVPSASNAWMRLLPRSDTRIMPGSRPSLGGAGAGGGAGGATNAAERGPSR